MGGFGFVFLLYFIPFCVFVGSWYVWFTRKPILGYNLNNYIYIAMGVSAGIIIVAATLYRMRLRWIHDINGNVVYDALAHLFCHPCAMVQEERELGILEEYTLVV